MDVPIPGSLAYVGGELGLFPVLQDQRGAQEGLQLSQFLGQSAVDLGSETLSWGLDTFCVVCIFCPYSPLFSFVLLYH